MKVLLLTSHLNIGGIPRYVLSLAAYLKQSGHDVRVASCGGTWTAQLTENGIEHLEIPLQTKFLFSPRILLSFFRLRKILREHPADIVHGNTRVSNVLAVLTARYSKIPYVTTFHGFYKPRLIRRMFPFTGDLTIAISHGAANHLHEDFNIPKDKIRVIHNGVNPDELITPLTRQEILQKYGLPEAAPRIGIVARFAPEKNHKSGILAFEKLLQKYPQAFLILAGHGDLEDDLKDLVREKKLDECVRFLDKMPGKEIFKILDLLIHPATEEGFGLVLAEAQMMEVPVIASRVPGADEIVVDGVSGLNLENPLNIDEICRKAELMLTDQSLRKKLVDSARKRAFEMFSIEQTTRKTFAVYQEITGKK